MTGTTKILIIDDDPDFGDYVRKVLDREGYEVLVAADGHAGVATARVARPSVILVDLLMAPENGFSVCERLRQAPETMSAAVVIVSAIRQKLHKTYASPEVGARLDADAFLDKPIDPKMLVKVVAEMHQLAKSRMSDTAENP